MPICQRGVQDSDIEHAVAARGVVFNNVLGNFGRRESAAVNGDSEIIQYDRLDLAAGQHHFRLVGVLR